MAKTPNDYKNVSKYDIGMKTARPISTMLRGVPDFTNAAQFNYYESGYEYLLVCRIPTFLAKAASQNKTAPDGTPVKTLINNFVVALEQEDKGISGIEDLTTETLEITDGITTMQQIGKVTKQGGSTFNMTFTEKSGTPIVKLCDYYIQGIKDGRTQAKTYGGLLDEGVITTPGFEKEVFTFLYINTDNTKKRIEKAILICNAQIAKADTSIYEATKGDIAHKDITLEINGFPVDGKQVNDLAKQMLKYLYVRDDDAKVVLDSSDYDYFITTDKKGFDYKGYNAYATWSTQNDQVTYDTQGTTNTDNDNLYVGYGQGYDTLSEPKINK